MSYAVSQVQIILTCSVLNNNSVLPVSSPICIKCQLVSIFYRRSTNKCLTHLLKLMKKAKKTHYNALIPFEILTDQGFLFIWKNNYENLQPFKKKTFNAFLYFYMTQFGVKFSRLHSSTYKYFYFRVTY